jgi:hypothetical protein
MDTKRLQHLAGVLNAHKDMKTGVLFESHDEDMSPAEKELVAKADADLKKKGIDVEKDVKTAEAVEKKLAVKKAAAKSAAKPATKPDSTPEKKEEKKAEPAKDEAPVAAAKKKHQAIEWLKAHKNCTRAEFVTAAEKWGMMKAYAGAYFYPLRKMAGGAEVKEAYLLLHPSVPRFALAENRQFNRYQWVSLEESKGFDPLVCYTRTEADRVAKYMLDHNSQDVTVEKLDLSK